MSIGEIGGIEPGDFIPGGNPVGEGLAPPATLAGGLRARMIFDNVYETIHSGVTALGWFGSGRRHQPVTMVAEEQDSTHEVAVNTLAVSDENVTNTPWELGAGLSEDRRVFYVDFFGESDAVAKHIIGDVRDVLLGKLSAIGRTGPVIDVYDLRQPTPPFLFQLEVWNVTVDRSHDYTHPWLRHWYSISFNTRDYYVNDLG